MDNEHSGESIGELLENLVKLLEEPYSGRESEWIGQMHRLLGWLEQALDTESSGPLQSEFFREISKAAPRLTSLCAKFHEDGRKLLRQAVAAVLLSIRNYETGTAPLGELGKTTALLVDAVRRHQRLESELLGEADQDIGGQG